MLIDFKHYSIKLKSKKTYDMNLEVEIDAKCNKFNRKRFKSYVD